MRLVQAITEKDKKHMKGKMESAHLRIVAAT